MVQEIMKSRCGVRFADNRAGLLLRLRIPVEEVRDPLQNNQQPFSQRDATEPIEDDLKLTLCKEIFQWIFWWILEGLPTYYEWQEMRSGQWVWLWQFRQVTHPLFRILAIVLIEYHDGGLPTTGRSWNCARGRVLPGRAEEHNSVKYCRDHMLYEPKAKPPGHRGVLGKILDALVTTRMWVAMRGMLGTTRGIDT